MFKPGQSGNPGGRPRADEETRKARELARQHCVAAIEQLVKWMRDKDPKVSLMACNSILDRGLGKPEQAVGLTGQIDISRLIIKDGDTVG